MNEERQIKEKTGGQPAIGQAPAILFRLVSSVYQHKLLVLTLFLTVFLLVLAATPWAPKTYTSSVRQSIMHKPAGLYTFFVEQVKLLRDSLSTLKLRLHRLESEAGLVDPSKQREFTLLRLTEHETQLDILRIAASETEKHVGFLEDQIETEPEFIRNQTRKVREAMIRSMSDELDSLKFVHNEIAFPGGADNGRDSTLAFDEKRIQSVKARIVEVEEAILREQLVTPKEVGFELSRLILSIAAKLRDLRFKSIGLKAREQELLKVIDKVRTRLNEIDEKLFVHERLKKQVDLMQSNYTLYVRKLEEARISNKIEQEKASKETFVKPEPVPLFSTQPNIMISLAAGFFLAVSVSVATAVLIEYVKEMYRFYIGGG